MTTVLSAITWDFQAEIFSIGSFAIRWYGVLFALGFYIGYLIMKKIYEKEKLNVEILDSLAMYMIIGSLLGARFGHCLFYEPDYYLTHPLDIIKPWSGELGKNAVIGIQGLASHGGAIGIIVCLIVFCARTKTNFVWLLDRLLIVVALGAGLIRLGNLMNQEIIGIPTNMPWGFVFTRLGDNIPRHPAQLYEALSYFLIFGILLSVYSKNRKKLPDGLLIGIFFISMFSMRFLIEFVKENQVGFEEGMKLNMGQLLSIPFIIAGFIFLVLAMKKRKNAVQS
ncbi:MAG: prolipoprotein diacylglyceryl transferase [Bacteroidia bacterium]|nr:MAG: prolipoprotein diacylglyceryl transferase [Bacteroidia bacterium]